MHIWSSSGSVKNNCFDPVYGSKVMVDIIMFALEFNPFQAWLSKALWEASQVFQEVHNKPKKTGQRLSNSCASGVPPLQRTRPQAPCRCSGMPLLNPWNLGQRLWRPVTRRLTSWTLMRIRVLSQIRWTRATGQTTLNSDDKPDSSDTSIWSNDSVHSDGGTDVEYVSNAIFQKPELHFMNRIKLGLAIWETCSYLGLFFTWKS